MAKQQQLTPQQAMIEALLNVSTKKDEGQRKSMSYAMQDNNTGYASIALNQFLQEISEPSGATSMSQRYQVPFPILGKIFELLKDSKVIYQQAQGVPTVMRGAKAYYFFRLEFSSNGQLQIALQGFDHKYPTEAGEENLEKFVRNLVAEVAKSSAPKYEIYSDKPLLGPVNTPALNIAPENQEFILGGKLISKEYSDAVEVWRSKDGKTTFFLSPLKIGALSPDKLPQDLVKIYFERNLQPGEIEAIQAKFKAIADYRKTTTTKLAFTVLPATPLVGNELFQEYLWHRVTSKMLENIYNECKPVLIKLLPEEAGKKIYRLDGYTFFTKAGSAAEKIDLPADKRATVFSQFIQIATTGYQMNLATAMEKAMALFSFDWSDAVSDATMKPYVDAQFTILQSPEGAYISTSPEIKDFPSIKSKFINFPSLAQLRQIPAVLDDAMRHMITLVQLKKQIEENEETLKALIKAEFEKIVSAGGAKTITFDTGSVTYCVPTKWSPIATEETATQPESYFKVQMLVRMFNDGGAELVAKLIKSEDGVKITGYRAIEKEQNSLLSPLVEFYTVKEPEIVLSHKPPIAKKEA